MCKPARTRLSARTIAAALAIGAAGVGLAYLVELTAGAAPYVIAVSLATFALTTVIMARLIIRQHAANRALFARLSSPHGHTRLRAREIEPEPVVTRVLSAKPVPSRTEPVRLALTAGRSDLPQLAEVRDTFAPRVKIR